MVYKIRWTATAREDYFQIVEYLREKWGQKSAQNFEIKVNKQLSLISKQPQIYPATKNRDNVRRCIVVKQISLYYLEIELDEELIILRFVDNRQNPDKLTKSLDDTDI